MSHHLPHMTVCRTKFVTVFFMFSIKTADGEAAFQWTLFQDFNEEVVLR